MQGGDGGHAPPPVRNLFDPSQAQNGSAKSSRSFMSAVLAHVTLYRAQKNPRAVDGVGGLVVFAWLDELERWGVVDDQPGKAKRRGVFGIGDSASVGAAFQGQALAAGAGQRGDRPAF